MPFTQYCAPTAVAPLCLLESEAESRRFSLRVARLDVPAVHDCTPLQIMELVENSPFDVVILRYPAIDVDWFAQLRSPRWSAVHADTLLYFEKLLRPSETTTSLVRLQRVTTTEQRSVLSRLASASFHRYRSHYFANPLFDKSEIEQGYQEWALGYSAEVSEAHCTFLAEMSSTAAVVGFISLLYQPCAEFALVAVAPTYSGQGLYGELLSAGELEFASRGATSCYISTQVHNLAVVRSVTKRGYRPALSLQTVHLVRDERRDR